MAMADDLRNGWPDRPSWGFAIVCVVVMLLALLGVWGANALACRALGM